MSLTKRNMEADPYWELYEQDDEAGWEWMERESPAAPGAIINAGTADGAEIGDE